MDSSEQRLPIGILLRNARRAKGISGVQLASQAGCTQSAISQFEGGKTTALRRETVEKIAEILGVALPPADESANPAGQGALIGAPVSAAAFCPNPACPSNVPYVVGNELVLHPRRQPDPRAVYCPWCGEVLERACPSCGSQATVSAFCPSCGQRRVEPPDGVADPVAWAEARRRELASLDGLLRSGDA